MRFEVLGPLVVANEAGPVALRQSHRRLLASLLVGPGSPVSIDVLVDWMWGEDPPATPRNTLHVHLSTLRRQLPGVISSDDDGYWIDSGAHEIDVLEFAALVASAADSLGHGRFREAGDRAEKAIGLWRGDPYPELDDVGAARGELHHLKELFTSAVTTQARALTLQGRMSESIGLLRQLVVDQPFNESLWEDLILAYYLAGRQADALTAFREASRVLGEELGVEPGPGLKDLEDRILLHDSNLVVGVAATSPNNLPNLDSSFVGRDEDLRAVQRLLHENHLVTITGAPGIGKTRLAMEVGESVLPGFPAGVWVARLAGARTDHDVLATLSAALSVSDKTKDLRRLFTNVAPRPTLLILDNCEHLLPAVNEFLTDRPHGCRLRVLATSRIRLGLPDEVVWPMQALPVPTSLDGMWESESLRLLADRVGAVDPTIDLATFPPEELMQVCARTAGIPLALELVARWIPSIDLRAFVGLGLDAPPAMAETYPTHHESVASAIAWSVDLLEPKVQEAFVKASVFASSFATDAFAQVCAPKAGSRAAIDSLTRLVEASLVVPERDQGEVRYRMLEPLREFGLGRLRSSRSRKATIERHAMWYTDVARELAVATTDTGKAAALDQVDRSIDDFRLTMRHLLDTDRHRDVLVVVSGLANYWYGRFLVWEGLSWLTEVKVDGLSDSDLKRYHRLGGFLSWASHDYEASDNHYQVLYEMGRQEGDERAVADALYGRGLIHDKRRFLDGGAMLEDAAAIYERIGGCDRELGQCLLFRGLGQADYGDPDLGSDLLRRAVDLLGRTGHHREVSRAKRWLARCATRMDDQNAARAYASQAESLARTVGDKVALAGALIEKARIDARWGEPSMAARHLIEAFEPIPAMDEIDICQVLLPVGHLAYRVGEPALAGAVLRHVDDVYDRSGWRPLDHSEEERRLREDLGDIDEVVPDLMASVHEFLSSLV